jgi:hypothetical protein
MAGSGNTQVFTDTDANATCFQFIRLGDSVWLLLKINIGYKEHYTN